jgi:YesN/AraC family two-component response regulator
LQQDETVTDIVLHDIVMPGMSGVEVAKWIFENKKKYKSIVAYDGGR